MASRRLESPRCAWARHASTDGWWDALQRLLLNPDTVLADVEAAASVGEARKRDAPADMTRLERAIAEVKTQHGRLLDLYLNGHLDQATDRAKAANLGGRRATLQEQQEDAQTRYQDGNAQPSPPDARALCALLAPRLSDLTFEQRHHLVRMLLTSIIATRKVIEIEGLSTPGSGSAASSPLAYRYCRLWTHQQHVMPARRRHFQGALDVLLPAHVGEVGRVGRQRGVEQVLGDRSGRDNGLAAQRSASQEPWGAIAAAMALW